MFVYEKKLQYPIRIANPNPRLAGLIISQYGGPDGELGASLRYLSQRYSMPYERVKGLLTDIGTEGSNLHPGRRPNIFLDENSLPCYDKYPHNLRKSDNVFFGDCLAAPITPRRYCPP